MTTATRDALPMVDGFDTRPLPLLSPAEQARTHLFALFRGGLLAGEWYELRCLDCRQTPTAPGPRCYFRSLTELIATAMSLKVRWDVFVGVGYRRCPQGTDITKCLHPERGADHISRLPTVWADIDVVSPDEPTKAYGSQAEALEVLTTLRVPPPLVVSSGAGLHAYWPLREPTTDLNRVVDMNQEIRDRVRGDNTVDAARILRVAGTLNHKHGVPLPVRILRHTAVKP